MNTLGANHVMIYNAGVNPDPTSAPIHFAAADDHATGLEPEKSRRGGDKNNTNRQTVFGKLSVFGKQFANREAVAGKLPPDMKTCRF